MAVETVILLGAAGGLTLLARFFSKHGQPIVKGDGNAPQNVVFVNKIEATIQSGSEPSLPLQAITDEQAFDQYKVNLFREMARPLHTVEQVPFQNVRQVVRQLVNFKWQEFQMAKRKRSLKEEFETRDIAGKLVSQTVDTHANYVQAQTRLENARNDNLHIQAQRPFVENKEKARAECEIAETRSRMEGLKLGSWKDKKVFEEDLKMKRSQSLHVAEARARETAPNHPPSPPPRPKTPLELAAEEEDLKNVREVKQAEKQAEVLKRFAQLAADLKAAGFGDEDATRMASQAHARFLNRELFEGKND